MNSQAPNMVDMMSVCTSGSPVALVSAPVQATGTPVVPAADGWKLFVFRGPNISWTVTGRKNGTSLAIRAEKLSHAAVESFDPNTFWKR